MNQPPGAARTAGGRWERRRGARDAGVAPGNAGLLSNNELEGLVVSARVQ